MRGKRHGCPQCRIAPGTTLHADIKRSKDVRAKARLGTDVVAERTAAAEAASRTVPRRYVEELAQVSAGVMALRGKG